MSPVPLSIGGIIDLDQYLSLEQQELFRQIVDPETEGALFFIAYSAIFIISCRLLYYSLKGTYLHKKLLEYIILSVIPQLGEEDWPHQHTIVIPPKSGVHNSTMFFFTRFRGRFWLLGTCYQKFKLREYQNYFACRTTDTCYCKYEDKDACLV